MVEDVVKAATAPAVLAPDDNHCGCSLWRRQWPIGALAAQGVRAEYRPDLTLGEAMHEEWPRVVTLPLDHPVWVLGSGYELLESLSNRGTAVVIDIDDNLLDVESYSSVAAQRHCHGQPDGGDSSWWTPRVWAGACVLRQSAIQLADGVTASTPRLADVVRQYTDRPVIVVPNTIDLGWWRAAVPGTRRMLQPWRRVRVIGWAGHCRPAEATEPLAHAWAALARRYPDVVFVTIGCSPEPLERAVPADRLRHVGVVPMQFYPAALAELDVLCATVTDSDFDLCKSPIKAQEAGASRVALVATHALYAPEVEHGVDGLLATTASEWETAIASLLEDPALRGRLVRARSQCVEREFQIDRAAWRWVEAWKTIVDAAAAA